MVANQSSLVTSLSTRSACAMTSGASLTTPIWSATTCTVLIERLATWVRNGRPSMSTVGGSGVPSWRCSSVATSASARRSKRPSA